MYVCECVWEASQTFTDFIPATIFKLAVSCGCDMTPVIFTRHQMSKQLCTFLYNWHFKSLFTAVVLNSWFAGTCLLYSFALDYQPKYQCQKNQKLISFGSRGGQCVKVLISKYFTVWIMNFNFITIHVCMQVKKKIRQWST